MESILRYQCLPSAYENWQPDIPENRRIISWLELAAEANLDTSRLVARLAGSDDGIVVQSVAACVSRYATTLAREQRLWDASDHAKQGPLKEWLLSWGRMEQRLVDAFFRCQNLAMESWISRELEFLRAWKATLPTYGV